MSLAPRCDLNSGCVWRRRPPDMKMVAVNVLNKQWQTAEKGYSFSFGVGREKKNSIAADTS